MQFKQIIWKNCLLKKKLQNCALIRGHIDNMMRDYCVMRDLGCNFDKEKLFV